MPQPMSLSMVMCMAPVGSTERAERGTIKKPPHPCGGFFSGLGLCWPFYLASAFFSIFLASCFFT
jgi:hypothetical protein